MSTATDMVTLYIDAEKKVLAGKSVSFNGRSWSMEDLAELRAGRTEWEQRAATEQRQAAGSYGARYMGPDFSDG